ncbi:MAG: hypothetical protein ACJAZO_003699 [Myxococcota bacterium]|jgi:hypothetical protein
MAAGGCSSSACVRIAAASAVEQGETQSGCHVPDLGGAVVARVRGGWVAVSPLWPVNDPTRGSLERQSGSLPSAGRRRDARPTRQRRPLLLSRSVALSVRCRATRGRATGSLDPAPRPSAGSWRSETARGEAMTGVAIESCVDGLEAKGVGITYPLDQR